MQLLQCSSRFDVAALLSLSVASWLCLGAPAAADDFKVLMIGNSYVQGNAAARDIGLDLQGLFDADPARSGAVTERAVSGWSLKTHAGDVTTTSLIANTTAYQWDAIVLQEQSNRPGRAIKFMDSQLDALDQGGPALIELIKQFQPQASVVLYSTWAKFPGHADLVQYFNNNADEMQSYTDLGYDRIQDNPGAWDHSDVTTIAPVGDAWQQWYATLGYANASTRLHDPDGTHQNDLGSYLSAAVLYETLTDSSSVGTSYSGAVTGTLGGEPIFSLLQRQATLATGVGAVANADFNGDAIVDGADFLIWQRGYGQEGSSLHEAGDATGDMRVDGDDLGIWQSQFNTSRGPAVAAVPEPTHLGCMLLAVVGLKRRRDARRNRLRSAPIHRSIDRRARTSVSAHCGKAPRRMLHRVWRRTQPLLRAFAVIMAIAWSPETASPQHSWAPVGSYPFSAWQGPSLGVFYSIPPGASADSPILIVIPGAKRFASEYRDQWNDLAVANGFITLVIQATKESFPTEYDYNLGGVANANGTTLPAERQLFSAIDALFEDFKARFGATRATYDLYGHSAGGGFVHRFLLFKPDAKVSTAIAANPAFVTMPAMTAEFPFGLRKAPLPDANVSRWFGKRLVILLGDRDLEPRTQPLSNSAQARAQGPHVFARGLRFFHSSLAFAQQRDVPFRWRLEVVPGVGHSNAHMASYAIKYLSLD